MKVICFFLAGLILAAGRAYGQCMPDTSACTPPSLMQPICSSPSQLPPGYAGEPYNESLVINLLRGSVLNGFDITISRLEIFEVNNLPPGITQTIRSGAAANGISVVPPAIVNPYNLTIPSNFPATTRIGINGCINYQGTPLQATPAGDSAVILCNVYIRVCPTCGEINANNVQPGINPVSIKFFIPIYNRLIPDAGADVEICQGATVLLTGSATGGSGNYSSVRWKNLSGDVLMTGYGFAAAPSTTTDYVFEVVDQVGFVERDTVRVTVLSTGPSVEWIVFGTPTGQIWALPSGGTPPYEYSLNGGAFQSMNGFTGLSAGGYLARVRDAAGCVVSRSITLGAEAVWPGDANANGTVNLDDFYLVSSGYGATGPARGSVSTLWAAQPAGNNWASTASYKGVNVNRKYLDANGDGVVNLLDVAASIVNRGQSHGHN
jgi:hypothetical protein